MTNWAGNYTYAAKALRVPENVDALRAIVKRSARIKALGARHSFNGVADSDGEQVSLEHFDQIEIDERARTVMVGAGVRYGTLATFLHEHGYALHNLASLPHITVAGACATATHGSGSKNGNLATAVAGIEMVTGEGELIVVARAANRDIFRGMVASLGALGIVTKLTLDLQPTFDMRQVVYENLPLSVLETRLDVVFASGYSVSLFTDWQNGRAAQMWVKRRDGVSVATTELFGARAAVAGVHPIPDMSAENCTQQMNLPGPWYERLPHFRIGFMASSGDELQAEYFVPREHGYAAIRAVEQLKDRIAPHLFISELRTIAADDLWMSPCYGRDSLAIHFTWKPHWPQVRELLLIIEDRLRPFRARPHWGKLFAMSASELRSLYPRLPDFHALVKQYDPRGKFRNAFLDAHVFGE